jgi:hypothetical protein
MKELIILFKNNIDKYDFNDDQKDDSDYKKKLWIPKVIVLV